MFWTQKKTKNQKTTPSQYYFQPIRNEFETCDDFKM